jgi:hypothetical protein
MPKPDGLQWQNTLPTPEGAATPTTALSPSNVWLYGGTGDAAGQSYYLRDQFPIDDFNRFYDQFHLTRNEIYTNSSYFSNIKTFDSIYRITPSIMPSSSDKDVSTKIDIGPAASGNYTSLLTSGAYYNLSGQSVDMNKWNTAKFLNMNDNSREATEYLILTSDEKINKIFFNLTPYAMNMQASTSAAGNQLSVAGVYYSKVSYDKIGENFSQNVEWYPVEFDNTTRIEKEYRNASNKEFDTLKYDLAKSGYISFDMPNDWGTISISGLAGGVFDESTSFTDDSSAGDTSYLKTFTGDVHESGIVSAGRKYYKVSGGTISTALGNYNENQIGCNQYVIRISNSAVSGDEGKTFWVGSGSESGWLPNLSGGTLVFQGGNVETTIGAGSSFEMRRVNIYNIFDGANKVTNLYDIPDMHNGASYNAYPYRFMLSGGTQSTIFNDVKDSLNDKYAIKIVVSGASGSFVSGAAHGGLEMWNILPYNNSYSQVIRQVDNSAYDLTMMPLTSDFSITYAGTYYQAVSKSGKVFVVRTGTPISSLSLSSKALADDSYADGNEPFDNNNPSGNIWSTYSLLRKVREAQNRHVRVMWDEKQKDGTWVRFFGFIIQVQESNKIGGPRAPRGFTFNLTVEEICLMSAAGKLMSGVIPLGGVKDAKSYI